RRKECDSYAFLNDTNRNINYTSSGLEVSWLCDTKIPIKWYRFAGNAGTQISRSCPVGGYDKNLKCQTHAVSWLNESHPTVSEGKVTRTVYFSWDGDCYHRKTAIEVINCGFGYIYRLVPVPHCWIRYCGV
ncbi:Hypothetical predicted protein, partial [Paramuricea clavata]